MVKERKIIGVSSTHEKSWTDRVKNLLRGLKDLLNICYKIP